MNETVPGIKPIETEYNGYKFRSRLEAKWAMFFDLIGITYQYEPDGYIVDGEKRYLPDFFLPSPFNVFVEIKRIDFEGLGNCFPLFKTTKTPVLLCKGDPMSNDMTFIVQDLWNRVCAKDASFCYHLDLGVDLHINSDGDILCDPDENPYKFYHNSPYENIYAHKFTRGTKERHAFRILSEPELAFPFGLWSDEYDEYYYENPLWVARKNARQFRFDYDYSYRYRSAEKIEPDHVIKIIHKRSVGSYADTSYFKLKITDIDEHAINNVKKENANGNL